MIDENGKFTGEMQFFAVGENKAVAMREVAADADIDLTESFAYSDSETDIPMLQAVGHPFAVNPDRTLTRVAHEHEWPILSFTHQVRAHDGTVAHPLPRIGRGTRCPGALMRTQPCQTLEIPWLLTSPRRGGYIHPYG